MFQFCYLLAVGFLVATTVRLPLVNISVSDLFLLAALCVWMWKARGRRSHHTWAFSSHGLWLPGTLVLIGGLLSSIRAVQPSTSVAISIKVWIVMTVWVSMTMVMVRRGHLRSVLWAFVTAVAITSVIGIHDARTGENWGGAISGRSDNFFGRMDGTTGHPNELGFVTSLAIPLTIGLLFDAWQRRRRWLIRGVLVLSLAVTCYALLGAGSVAAWVSTTLSMIVIVTIAIGRFARRTGSLLVWATAVVALVAATVAVQAPSHPEWFAQINTLLDSNLGRVSSNTGPGRWRLMEEAAGRIREHPWIGAGMDQTGTGGLAVEELVTEERVHNAIVGGWLAGGLLVFLGLVWAYAVVLLGAMNALWVGVRRSDWITIAIGASTIGWIFFDQTQPNLSHRYTWMTMGFIFGLGLQVRWSTKSVELRQRTAQPSS